MIWAQYDLFMANMICLGGVWMHPRYVMIWYALIWYDMVTGAGCNPLLSQNMGASYSTWRMRTPLILSDYLRGLPSIWLWRYDAIWYVICYDMGSWWMTVLNLILYFLFLYLVHYDMSVHVHLILFPFIIYLFTGLFKLSRISFPAAGFSRKPGAWVCFGMRD